MQFKLPNPTFDKGSGPPNFSAGFFCLDAVGKIGNAADWNVVIFSSAVGLCHEQIA